MNTDKINKTSSDISDENNYFTNLDNSNKDDVSSFQSQCAEQEFTDENISKKTKCCILI